MKFAPIAVTELPLKNARANTETTTLVTEFLDAGVDVAEVDPEGKKIETVRTSIQNAINRVPNGKAQVKVMTRAGRLFLVRQSPEAAAPAENDGSADSE